MHLKELETISHHDFFDNFDILTKISFKGQKNLIKLERTTRNLDYTLKNSSNSKMKKKKKSSKSPNLKKKLKKDEFLKLRNKYQKKILERMPFHLKLDIDNKENINPNVGYFKSLGVHKSKKSHSRNFTMARLLQNQRSIKRSSKDTDVSGFLLKKQNPSESICSIFKSENIYREKKNIKNLQIFEKIEPKKNNRSLGKMRSRKRSGVSLLRKIGRDSRDRSYSLIPSQVTQSRLRVYNRDQSINNRRFLNRSIGDRKKSKSYGKKSQKFRSNRGFERNDNMKNGGYLRNYNRRKLSNKNENFKKRTESKFENFTRKLNHLKKSNSIKANLLRKNPTTLKHQRTFSRSKIEGRMDRTTKSKKRPKTQRILKSFSQVMRDSSKNLLKRINSRITPKVNHEKTVNMTSKDIQFSTKSKKNKKKAEKENTLRNHKHTKETILDPSLKRLALVIGAQKKLGLKRKEKVKKEEKGYMSGRYSSLGTLGNCLRRIRGEGRLGSYIRKRARESDLGDFGHGEIRFSSIYSTKGC